MDENKEILKEGRRKKKERTENFRSRMWTPKSVDRYDLVKMNTVFMRTVSASRALVASVIGTIHVKESLLAQA